MTTYVDLAAQAEAGQLAPKPGTIRRGSAAAEAAQRALMDATGTDTIAEAVTIARGRPRLDAAAPSEVTWKIRTTAVLDEQAQAAARTLGITRSQLIRDAVANYVPTLAVKTKAGQH